MKATPKIGVAGARPRQADTAREKWSYETVVAGKEVQFAENFHFF